MDCSLPGSSVHGILQARILEWIAIPFSRGIFPTQGWDQGLLHCRWILYHLSHCLQCRRPGFDPWVWKIPLEKGMATHSSILVLEIPWTEDPGRLQSMVSKRVGHY